MKHSRSHGGAGGGSACLSGLISNYNAYQRWCEQPMKEYSL